MTNDAVPAAASNGSAGWLRLWRGWSCLATFAIAPLGWFVRGKYIRRLEAERLDAGLVLILPGIEGRSFLNIAVLQGLLDSGLPYALEIVDWTTGFKGFVLYHLRGTRRNRRIAAQLAARIAEYRQQYPGRPVWIVGHSGGGGMSLLTAESLPDEQKLTGIVLLAAAVSPRFQWDRVSSKIERGVWNFSSPLDCLFVGLGTTVFGSLDGRWGPCAGMLGFQSPPETMPWPLTEVRYRPGFIRQFHLGGHFGCVHRVFIAESVAPILHAMAAEQAGSATDVSPHQNSAAATPPAA